MKKNENTEMGLAYVFKSMTTTSQKIVKQIALYQLDLLK